MHRITRKLVVGLVTAVSALGLTVGPALAFECYNATRSSQGNESASGAPALISLEEALMLFCGIEDPDEIADIIDALDEGGFRTDVLINGHALMAGGLELNGKGEEKLHDGQAIDHLSDEFFEALFALAPSCAGEEGA